MLLKAKELRFVAFYLLFEIIKFELLIPLKCSINPIENANQMNILYFLQLSNNIVDSYSLPPADSFAPDFHKRPPTDLTPPNSFPYPLSFKQRPIHVSAPRHPVSFRPPVPQGLFESIGQAVQHQDKFGVKLRPQSNVYLPPPTSQVPLPAPGGLFSNIISCYKHKHTFMKAREINSNIRKTILNEK